MAVRRHSSKGEPMRHRRVALLGLGALVAVVLAPPTPAQAGAGTWTQVAAPDPDVQFTYLQSVDGRTDTDAWAVGYVQPTGVAPTYPISLRWNGTAWSSVPVPLLGIGTLLWGVSASASTEAWAVGSVST